MASKKNDGGKAAASASVLKLVMIIHSTGKTKMKTSTQVNAVTRYPETLRLVNLLLPPVRVGAAGRPRRGCGCGCHQPFASSVNTVNSLRSARVAMTMVTTTVTTPYAAASPIC